MVWDCCVGLMFVLILALVDGVCIWLLASGAGLLVLLSIK